MNTGALDIGGSSVKYALVTKEDGHPRVSAEFDAVPLPDNEFESLKRIVTELVGVLHQEHGALSIGISTTGSVDREGIVVSAGHFNGYENVAWEGVLKDTFPGLKRVATANDGRAAAWAEFSVERSDVRSLVHAVVGTGVGGGIVNDGKLLLGDSGQSGYIGHIKVSLESPVTCSCGKVGCVEAFASSRGIAASYQTAVGGDPESGSFDQVVEAATAGEDQAIQVFTEAGWWLGRGLGNAMNVVNPAVVTVGGGVTLAATEALRRHDVDYIDAIREGIREAAHRRVFASADLRLARFGNDSGLLGAALLVS